MAAIVKIIGWLATAGGLIFIVLPFVVSSGLSVDTMVSLCIFLLVMGPLLVGLSQLIEVAEKIQANTNWFSTGGMPAAQPEAEIAEAPQNSEPEPEPVPAAPEQVPTAPAAPTVPTAPAAPVERPAEPAVPRSERQPQRPPAPELYDANVHPAAVDEWTHNNRRVMTLEDGTFATEVNGAWYRFRTLNDIDALRQ